MVLKVEQQILRWRTVAERGLREVFGRAATVLPLHLGAGGSGTFTLGKSMHLWLMILPRVLKEDCI